MYANLKRVTWIVGKTNKQSKRQTVISVGKDVEKLNPLYTAGGNAK
jgi:hypothetical protein